MLKDKKLAIFTLVFVMVALFFAVLAAKPSFAADETSAETNEIAVIVRPLVIINISAVPGENFTVTVNVTVLGTMDLHGFTMKLSYDPALVQCTNVSNGDLFQTNATGFSLRNNTEGNVYASWNFTSSNFTIDSNGTLVTLMFQVKATGETSLHIYDAFLYNSSGTYLQYTAYDGYFNNKFNFDITMPLTLLTVTFASMLLNPKIEHRLKGMLEEREFRVRDAVMLVGLMAVLITVVVVIRQLSTILMVLFLFSYSLLLFTFGYLLSKNRWYVGVLAPAVFILLYAFLRDSFVWTFYLSNIYGLVFAIMITLYLAGLFNWKTTAVFGGLLTAMDIVLVLVTKTMVQAANAAASLSLPVLVSLPLFPLITTGTGVLMLSLGLGDFFFAGLLAVQTFKKYGRRLAIASVIGMTVSFSIFEAFILTYRIGAFPGTLMIICGWIPFVLFQTVKNWKSTRSPKLEKVLLS
jgi:hypothetical protein